MWNYVQVGFFCQYCICSIKDSHDLQGALQPIGLWSIVHAAIHGAWLDTFCEGGDDVQNLILVELLCRFHKQAQQDAKK